MSDEARFVLDDLLGGVSLVAVVNVVSLSFFSLDAGQLQRLNGYNLKVCVALRAVSNFPLFNLIDFQFALAFRTNAVFLNLVLNLVLSNPIEVIPDHNDGEYDCSGRVPAPPEYGCHLYRTDQELRHFAYSGRLLRRERLPSEAERLRTFSSANLLHVADRRGSNSANRISVCSISFFAFKESVEQSQNVCVSKGKAHIRAPVCVQHVILALFPLLNAGFPFLGLGPVRIGDEHAGKWGYIDKQGHFAVNPQFAYLDHLVQGLARVKDEKTGKWGYLDKQGHFVVPPQFDVAQDFAEGLAAVEIGGEKTGKWGYIDLTGHYVVNPQFDWTTGFGEGLAAVQIGNDKTGKWGYIDKQGHAVVIPQFGWAGQFSDGLAPVRIGDEISGKWGYISR